VTCGDQARHQLLPDRARGPSYEDLHRLLLSCCFTRQDKSVAPPVTPAPPSANAMSSTAPRVSQCWSGSTSC